MKIPTFFLATILLVFAFSAQASDFVGPSDFKSEVPQLTKVPQFPGGLIALRQFLNENLQYPELAKENGIEGTVVLEFTVMENGQIQMAGVKKGIGLGCDEEALRVLSLMPDWKPGYKMGKAVKTRLNLPIQFTLK